MNLWLESRPSTLDQGYGACECVFADPGSCRSLIQMLEYTHMHTHTFTVCLLFGCIFLYEEVLKYEQ